MAAWLDALSILGRVVAAAPPPLAAAAADAACAEPTNDPINTALNIIAAQNFTRFVIVHLAFVILVFDPSRMLPTHTFTYDQPRRLLQRTRNFLLA